MTGTPKKRSQLLLLQLNDVHGYVDLHPDWFWESGRTVYRHAGGYARLATLVEARRRQYPDATVLLDGGGTQFMVVDELLAAFRKQHPQ